MEMCIWVRINIWVWVTLLRWICGGVDGCVHDRPYIYVDDIRFLVFYLIVANENRRGKTSNQVSWCL